MNKISFSKLVLIAFISVLTAGCASQQQQENDDKILKARARSHTDLGAAYYQQKQLEMLWMNLILP